MYELCQAKYHEEFEKKIKGSKIQVADDPETQRLKQLNAIVSQVEYKGLKEKVSEMETHRQNVAAVQDDNCTLIMTQFVCVDVDGSAFCDYVLYIASCSLSNHGC